MSATCATRWPRSHDTARWSAVMSQASITAHFTTELAQARQAAVYALGGQRYPRLLEDLDAMLADPPLTPLG